MRHWYQQRYFGDDIPVAPVSDEHAPPPPIHAFIALNVLTSLGAPTFIDETADLVGADELIDRLTADEPHTQSQSHTSADQQTWNNAQRNGVTDSDGDADADGDWFGRTAASAALSGSRYDAAAVTRGNAFDHHFAHLMPVRTSHQTISPPISAATNMKPSHSLVYEPGAATAAAVADDEDSFVAHLVNGIRTGNDVSVSDIVSDTNTQETAEENKRQTHTATTDAAPTINSQPQPQPQPPAATTTTVTTATTAPSITPPSTLSIAPSSAAVRSAPPSQPLRSIKVITPITPVAAANTHNAHNGKSNKHSTKHATPTTLPLISIRPKSMAHLPEPQIVKIHNAQLAAATAAANGQSQAPSRSVRVLDASDSGRVSAPPRAAAKRASDAADVSSSSSTGAAVSAFGGPVMSAEFAEWCKTSLAQLPVQADVSLADFLMTLTDDDAVAEIAHEYLGTSAAADDWIETFCRTRQFESAASQTKANGNAAQHNALSATAAHAHSIQTDKRKARGRTRKPK